jgi:glycosyltransferase involved in cell wall biosynthesis
MQDSAVEGGVAQLVFLGDSLATWTGGVDFLRLCIATASSVAPERSWDLLLPRKTLAQRVRAAARLIFNALLAAVGRKVSFSRGVSVSELKDAMTNTGSQVNLCLYRNSSAGLAKILTERKAEVLFPCARSLGNSFPYGWIGYIPDLQHKRLPHFFSARDREKRDEVFSTLLADAAAVIVNAKSVISDIEKYYPNRRAKLFALPFCPPPIRNLFGEKSDVLNKYALPNRYFMISNQFWVHKSHETAFIALGLAAEAGLKVHLVCTGNPHDYRRPEHFNELKSLIAEKRVEDQIHFLGVIPKRDQLAMMRQSVAVIQPTLFEGGPGGGSVYDAISTGTPAIVSDIEVNREIDIGIVEFFKAGSPEDLAATMLKMLSSPPQRMSSEATIDLLSKRQREAGARLLEIARWVTERHSTTHRARAVA